MDINTTCGHVPSGVKGFKSPFGRYRFNRMPFGIKSAPEVFKKIISQVEEDIDGAEAIIDHDDVHLFI